MYTYFYWFSPITCVELVVEQCLQIYIYKPINRMFMYSFFCSFSGKIYTIPQEIFTSGKTMTILTNRPKVLVFYHFTIYFCFSTFRRMEYINASILTPTVYFCVWTTSETCHCRGNILFLLQYRCVYSVHCIWCKLII